MNKITIVMPYYRNPETLRAQVNMWNAWPVHLQLSVGVLLVDDASPEPAVPIFTYCNMPKRLFRVREDRRWNQHAARNIGAHEAPDGWMLMTDMDIWIRVGEMEKLLVGELDRNRHYTFNREFNDGRPPKVHCNTFLVTKEKFWEAGGYDERFCGAYGGDGVFLRALERAAPKEHLDKVTVEGFSPLQLEDCNTRGFGRKNTPDHDEYIRRRKEFEGLPPLTMTCKYDRVF